MSRTAERSCVACRTKGAQQQFIRYVIAPNGELVVDYRHRLPGRGAYTCFDRACIDKALKNRCFERAFRRSLALPDRLALGRMIADAISQRILGVIGIARKAGGIVSGTSQLQAAFNRDDVRFLLIAEDAADGSAEKMMRLADQHGVMTKRFSDRMTLGTLSGSGNRNCIGVTDEQFAEVLALEINSLQQIAGEN